MIPIEKIKLVVPNESISFEIQGTLEMFSINTVLRASHFISQCKHESDNFVLVQENLNYSQQGLMSVFKKYFPDQLTAQAYAKKPEKIANRVYANRMGNGGEESGDGWKFHGRGFIQITGKNNYIAFSNFIDEKYIIDNPDIVATGKYRSLSAGWFWKQNGLNDIADKGSDDAVVQEITKRINGGLNEITERIKLFKDTYKKLSS